MLNNLVRMTEVLVSRGCDGRLKVMLSRRRLVDKVIAKPLYDGCRCSSAVARGSRATEDAVWILG